MLRCRLKLAPIEKKKSGLYINFCCPKKVTKMQIKNLTKKTAISRHGKICEDALSKFMGLMFSLKQKNALIFKFGRERIISLHMIFVFYPIDVLFLDKNKIVVGKKERFGPFTFCSSKKKAVYAIELPSGTIKKTKTGIGNRIGF